MKIKNLLFPAFVLFIISCKKSSQTNTQPQGNYLTTTTGSTWNYHQIDSSGSSPVNSDYTVTSSSKDSLSAEELIMYSILLPVVTSILILAGMIIINLIHYRAGLAKFSKGYT